MKVAITSEGQNFGSRIDPHFGRAQIFILLDTETNEFLAHVQHQEYQCVAGAGIQVGRTIAGLGAGAVITGNVGPKALTVLRAAKVEVYTGVNGTVEEAFERLKAGDLQSTDVANAEGDRI